MKNTYEKIGASLIIAFSLAGCGESKIDIARKPELVTAMVSDSMSKCKINEPAIRDSDYETRLRSVLLETKSASLDYIKANSITVCLDARIPNQKIGFWDHRVDAVYYGGQTNRVIGLWDNGMAGEGRSLLHQDTTDYDSNFLNKFSEYANDGDFKLTDHFAFGGRYSCGKGCITERWKAEGDFDNDTITKNPELLKSPVELAVPATKDVPFQTFDI